METRCAGFVQITSCSQVHPVNHCRGRFYFLGASDVVPALSPDCQSRDGVHTQQAACAAAGSFCPGARMKMAVGQNQWYHFGVGAPPILGYLSGDWDVHWGYDLDFDPWPNRGMRDPSDGFSVSYRLAGACQRIPALRRSELSSAPRLFRERASRRCRRGPANQGLLNASDFVCSTWPGGPLQPPQSSSQFGLRSWFLIFASIGWEAQLTAEDLKRQMTERHSDLQCLHYSA